MKGLFIFLGESFRLGQQGTRNIGSDKSYTEQLNAAKSHINLIENLEAKNCKISVYLSTYYTKFNNELKDVYKNYLIGSDFYNKLIGYNALLHNSISKIKDVNIYDFVFFVRIDLFFKDKFIPLFNPNWKMILFPSICFVPCHKSGIHPRVNDMMIFIPKKYYNYIKNIQYNPMGHDIWANLIKNTDLKYEDIDTMLNTYHDSDSAKDFNPIYYIVNRPICDKFHSDGLIFDKLNF